jgi:hypothetical protein
MKFSGGYLGGERINGDFHEPRLPRAGYKGGFMGNGRISLREVEGYIRNKKNLRKALQKDYRENRILSEADMEACICHHLRIFLKADRRWRVFARAYRKRFRSYPDITVLEARKPRLAVEVKKGRKGISGKDRRTLNKFLRSDHAGKAYFISTVRNKRDYKKLGADKTEDEKNRLMEIPVSLDLHGTRLADFEKERQLIRRALK